MTYFLIYFVLFHSWISLLRANNDLKNYDVFTAGDKTKWIQVSQLEPIFTSIADTLRELNEKRKQDSSLITQLSVTIQSANTRLQNLEEQMNRVERAETYNKIQLQQFSDGSIKEELQIDQISQRIERNQQQLNRRLNEVDNTLEIITKVQDVIGKEIRKINVAQNALTSNVDELNQHTQQQSTNILQNITSAQRELREKLKESGTHSNPEEKVRVITVVEPAKNNSNQNDETKIEWLTLLTGVENKVQEIQSQMQTMETNLRESSEIAYKIYNKLDQKKDDRDPSIKDSLNALFDQIKQQNLRDLGELEGKLKVNFQSILNEQVHFKNSCQRLQEYETQMEDKAVQILEKILGFLVNKTYEIQKEIQTFITREEKNYGMHFVPKPFEKFDAKRIIQNVTLHRESNDSIPTIPASGLVKSNVTNNLDGTNLQGIRVEQLEKKPLGWSPSETDKVWLSDEPAKKDSIKSKKAAPVVPEPPKINSVMVEEAAPVVPEPAKINSVMVEEAAPDVIYPALIASTALPLKPKPEHFFGIDGLSRKRRSPKSSLLHH